MDFLHLLEKIRFPGMNELMMGITYLGDETAFLVLSLIIFWCINKKMGYYVLTVGFVGTVINQFLKLLVRIPRPWVLDSNIQIVEAARASAGGYSFPSGHTQNAVGTFGTIACTVKNKWVRGICIALAILIPFSRMYLGVHTPWDVGAAALLALILIFLFHSFIWEDESGSKLRKLLPVLVVLAALFLAFTKLYPFPENIDVHNLASGQKNASTLLGAVSGFLIVYWADQRYLHFDTDAVWWAQILKAVGGLTVVLMVKIGIKYPLTWLIGPSGERIVRYFLVVMVAGIFWPMTFPWFSKLGHKHDHHDHP